MDFLDGEHEYETRIFLATTVLQELGTKNRKKTCFFGTFHSSTATKKNIHIIISLYVFTLTFFKIRHAPIFLFFFKARNHSH